MEWMFMPLRRYAEFSGRSRRMEYWMFAVLQIVIVISFWLLLTVIGGTALLGGNMSALVAAGGALLILALVYCVIWLALLIPAIAVGVRRLHDTNRSGWWILAPLLGYVLSAIGGSLAAASPNSGMSGAAMLIMIGGLVSFGLAITLLVFMLLDGTPGPNRFGEDPKGRGRAEVFA